MMPACITQGPNRKWRVLMKRTWAEFIFKRTNDKVGHRGVARALRLAIA